jgi:hypothetical protein
MEELKTEPVLEYRSKRMQYWRDHVNRKDRTRIPTQILQHAPCGRRYTRHKHRTGDTMSTERIKQGFPQKFCSTRLGAEGIQGIKQ